MIDGKDHDDMMEYLLAESANLEWKYYADRTSAVAYRSEGLLTHSAISAFRVVTLNPSMKCLLMRYLSIRCLPIRCLPMRCLSMKSLPTGCLSMRYLSMRCL